MVILQRNLLYDEKMNNYNSLYGKMKFDATKKCEKVKKQTKLEKRGNLSACQPAGRGTDLGGLTLAKGPKTWYTGPEVEYMYRYIFFDLDGTLTDSKEGIFNCIRYALDEEGFTEIETPIIEGAKTVEACLAIIESSKTGKIVNPNYNF